MRLSIYQQQIILKTAQQLFGDLARVSLFGSRINDNLRGGDIDLLIELPYIEMQRQKKSLTFVALLQQQIGLQPIDVVILDPSVSPTVFHQQILQNSLLLNA